MAESKNKSNWEIIKNLLLLEVNPGGWKKELNVVSWYGNEAVLDLRWWHPDRTRCGKGITMTKEQLKNMYKAMNELLETDIQVS